MSPRVILRLGIEALADLHAWGYHRRTWWALVSWTAYARLGDHNGHVNYSAWGLRLGTSRRPRT
jgi:hypothetical protein